MELSNGLESRDAVWVISKHPEETRGGLADLALSQQKLSQQQLHILDGICRVSKIFQKASSVICAPATEQASHQCHLEGRALTGGFIDTVACRCARRRCLKIRCRRVYRVFCYATGDIVVASTS